MDAGASGAALVSLCQHGAEQFEPGRDGVREHCGPGPNSSPQLFGAMARAVASLTAPQLLVLGVAGFSMLLNFRFGLLIIAGPERWFFAVIVALLDGVKTVLLNHVAAHLANWRRPISILRGMMGLAIWAGLVAFSLYCSIGLYAMARDARDGDARKVQAQHREFTERRGKLLRRIDALENAATVESITGEIRAMKHSQVWDRSAQCANATLPESREFCAGLARLEAALAMVPDKASRDADLAAARADLAAVQVELSALDPDLVYAVIDAAAAAIAAPIGRTVDDVKNGLAVLIGLLIESVAAAGLFVLSDGRPPSPPQDSGRQIDPPTRKETTGNGVDQWVASALTRRSGSTAAATPMHLDYTRWAETHGFDVANQTAFGRRLRELGFAEKGRNDAGAFYRDVSFTPRAQGEP